MSSNPTQRKRPGLHRVGIAAFDGVVLGDLATPCELFGRARGAENQALYDVRVCASQERVQAGLVGLHAPWRLAALATCHTIIVPGIEFGHSVPRDVVQALAKAVARGTRVASICSGAFVLAATGALNGQRATTHWMAAAELARRHPSIDVDAEVLYVDLGQVLTSAGAAAGQDLCLHMIRRDHGATVAASVARMAVLPMERAGGQAQFIVRQPLAAQNRSMAEVQQWIVSHLGEPLNLADLADAFAMSARTLSRHFQAAVGMSPARWISQLRVTHAQELLESTDLTIEQIATATGFGSAVVFRQRFGALVGTSPAKYRSMYRPRVRHPLGAAKRLSPQASCD